MIAPTKFGAETTALQFGLPPRSPEYTSTKRLRLLMLSSHLSQYKPAGFTCGPTQPRMSRSFLFCRDDLVARMADQLTERVCLLNLGWQGPRHGAVRHHTGS